MKSFCKSSSYSQYGLRAGSFGLAEDFAHALVVEQRRNASRADKHAHAGPNDKGFRVVEIDVLAADKTNGKRAKRTTLLIGAERFFEVL